MADPRVNHPVPVVPDGLLPPRLRISDEKLYALLVGSVRDYGIFALDPTGRIATWNIGAQTIKGYRADEIIGRHFSVFYPPEDLENDKPGMELREASAHGRFEDEGWRVRKDGTRFWANVVITALRNPDGDLVGFAKVTRDLTERRQNEERALADTRRLAEAEAANRAKTEFLSTMSHELRTPLNAIDGYAELLELEVRGPVTEGQREFLRRIRDSQRHLLGIINDLLNYSRIEAGRVEYEVARVPLSEIVSTVMPMVEPQALARGLVLSAGPCPPELVASADRGKAEQVLLNLLSNAVKFTESGTVTVACAASPAGVTITVSDTGEGIAPDRLLSVFEPFVQLGRSLSQMREGTGLGLAISRDLARGMGGDLAATSTPGQGSVFTLTLPAG
ncbi:PAS domain-containing sensor histidine kinase [Longimicrobium terrae]|uniref:histidine kinase n=1 Tax=Longimicrobium terrae TaxID=1639882 RepID=A0A841GP71_9BACT|nr:PAS domain-containing sensor histidine kinase [Longimicrobium terrae]MBB4634737.1 PAS domain S-box-containing protein [Longimicrobium terrae]MBB6069132.1 PAS domain S-box-containing protein [Longimicrobium terrae]NNC32051.1 PAS domain-containing sensor histidine kinase [Longimicrobium terrae]